MYCIELCTEAYATHYHRGCEETIALYIEVDTIVQQLGLVINAGHDLDLNNLKFFADNVPGLLEVSIGHALIADTLYYGLENVIQLYLRQLAAKYYFIGKLHCSVFQVENPTNNKPILFGFSACNIT